MTDNSFNISIPTNVGEVCSILEDKGFETYIVGGCVRDAILGKEPHDYDVTTQAPPEQVDEIFGHKDDSFVLDIDGATSHGVTFVMYKGEQIEIATFRQDGEYIDGRHCTVKVGGVSITEDLKRRDFTMNAMAYRPTTNELIDLFGGVEDCKNGIIRTVGSAKERFGEDALRILRAFRFQSQLGFVVDDEIFAAAKSLRNNISLVSGERIAKEMTKLLCDKGFDPALRNLYETGVMDVIMPEFRTIMECEQNNPHHCYSVGNHTLKCMENVSDDAVMRWAALFHDFGKPTTKVVGKDGLDHFPGHPKVSSILAEEILRRFHFDNAFIKAVTVVVANHDVTFATPKAVRRFLSKYSEKDISNVLELRRADVLGQNPNYHFDEKLEEVELAKALVNNTIDELHHSIGIANIKDMAISGRDLLDMGMKPGPAIGEVLKALYDIVLEDPSKNKKEVLKEIAKSKVG